MIKKSTLIKKIGEELELDYIPIFTDAGSLFLNFTGNDFNQSIVISYKKYPGAYVLPDYLYGWKALDLIENFLAKYFKKYNLSFQLTTIHIQSRWHSELSKISLEKESDIPKVIPYLREMVYEDILPFFAKYQSVEQVYEEMEKNGDDVMFISKFIFTPMPIRRMIIKRLVNEPNWEAYAAKIVHVYTKKGIEEKNPQYTSFAQFLPELFQELQEMKI